MTIIDEAQTAPRPRANARHSTSLDVGVPLSGGGSGRWTKSSPWECWIGVRDFGVSELNSGTAPSYVHGSNQWWPLEDSSYRFSIPGSILVPIVTEATSRTNRREILFGRGCDKSFVIFGSAESPKDNPSNRFVALAAHLRAILKRGTTTYSQVADSVESAFSTLALHEMLPERISESEDESIAFEFLRRGEVAALDFYSNGGLVLLIEKGDRSTVQEFPSEQYAQAIFQLQNAGFGPSMRPPWDPFAFTHIRAG